MISRRHNNKHFVWNKFNDLVVTLLEYQSKGFRFESTQVRFKVESAVHPSEVDKYQFFTLGYVINVTCLLIVGALLEADECFPYTKDVHNVV